VGASACEHERHDERIERSEAQCAENSERDDSGGGYRCGGAEQNLGEDQQCKADTIELGFAEEGDQHCDEDATGEFCGPEENGDGRGMERWVGEDGIAGEPASEGVLDADVEEGSGAEDEER